MRDQKLKFKRTLSMSSKSLLILFLVFISIQTKAQSSYFYNDQYYDNPVTFEAGISLGAMNSLTDIGGKPGLGKNGPKDFNMKSTTPDAGIFFGGIYKHFLGFRIEGTIGTVKSNDSLLKGVQSPNKAIGRYNRNLSFRSPINEVSLLLEFHPVDFFRVFDPYGSPPTFSPYLVGGVGYFHFNPQGKYGSKWIDLRPLHTEGEGFAEYPDSKEYNLNQLNFSVGIGVAYELSPKINLKIEYVNRKLNTDYLDDVHGRYIDPAIFGKYLTGNNLTYAMLMNRRIRGDADPNQTTQGIGSIRGNPANNDSYFTLNIKIGYIIGRDLINGGNSKYNRAMRSPTRF
jgi:opacity protein-like surface antigen